MGSARADRPSLTGFPSPSRPPAAVLDFSEVLADREAHGKVALELYDSGRYMRLDAAAQRALNVLRGRADANDTFSLYGLLNRGRTPMGKRLCKVGSCCTPCFWHGSWPGGVCRLNCAVAAPVDAGGGRRAASQGYAVWMQWFRNAPTEAPTTVGS